MRQQIRRCWKNESGQDMVKYAVFLAMRPPRSRRGQQVEQTVGTGHRHFSNNVFNNLNTI